jgi:hypothetical protein
MGIQFFSVEFTDGRSLICDNISKDVITKKGYPEEVGIAKIVIHLENDLTQTLE